MAQGRYEAADIEVLEGLEPVRKRPGMFIAGTDTPAGLHQLVSEILDNSVDEAMNGYATRIEVCLHADGSSVTISDNGRGIPVEKHPKFNRPTLELILTTLHAGGKFSDKNYATAGGLHGVGTSVVNALSEELIATVRRGGKEYAQRFARGIPQGAIKVTKRDVNTTGTEMFFRPDSQIFSSTQFSPSVVRSLVQTKAYLNPGLKLLFVDEARQSREEFEYDNGLSSYLKELLEARSLEPVGGEAFHIESINGTHVSIALAWTESNKEEFWSYVNGIHTTEGGSHEIGARNGILKAVRNYINVHDLQPKGVKIISEDIREGILCLVSVKLPSSDFSPQFQGQTKSKLNNPEVTPIVESAVRSLERLLNEKQTVAQAVANRVILAARARVASRAAQQSVTRKIGVSHRLNLPGKLADCSGTRQDQTELFIVEGDSAGGSAKQARDRHFQAVLPLRGKVLNTIAASGKNILENKELSNIISALGSGIRDKFSKAKLRYGKVIILTDADADGMHISTLLLAFFFSYFRPLIECGALYLGRPPLYGIFPDKNSTQKTGKASGGKKKRGGLENAYWAYSDDELEQVIRQHKLSSPKIVRYKGLGEMNPETLWETTLDPATRTLLRVTTADEAKTWDALNVLMGNDSSGRYELIQTYAAQLEPIV
ncbi:MAG: type IIA DNA topoisomerase subunit B [Deltaproteobacteria bacterium]|nr:type IIA DNA topoisomerase subunit B [Deltaproteobacteria bacterium]